MSLTAEDLKAISDLMDKKFDEKLLPINQRLDKIENKLEIIEEDVEIIKGSMEVVLEWFSTYQRDDKIKPFPAREADIELKIKIDEKALGNS